MLIVTPQNIPPDQRQDGNQTLDDIEFSDKSASKQQIEKFVDENPEAVVALLRNWLNDDWE